MSIGTKYWRPGFSNETKNSAVTIENLNANFGMNYLLDVRRKRTTDGTTQYINQGGCYLPGDKYLLVLCNIDYSVADLVVVDLANYTFYTIEKNVVGLNHANDCAYYNGQVVFTTWNGSSATSSIAFYSWDGASFKSVRVLGTSVNLSSVAFDNETGELYGRAGQTIYKVDTTTGKCTKLFRYSVPYPSDAFYNNIVDDYSNTGQGMEYHNGLFYVCYSFPNYLLVVDKEAGEAIDMVNIPQVNYGHVVGELESFGISHESGRMFLAGYGRSINDYYDLSEGEDAELTWGFTNVYEFGPLAFNGTTLEYRNAKNTATSNTIGSRRNIYIEAKEDYESGVLRHTGTVDYPFDTLQNAFFFAGYTKDNTSRRMPEIIVKGNISAYSKWASVYLSCLIHLEDGKLPQVHVGEGCSIKIDGTGTVESIFLIQGSNLDVRVPAGKVQCSSNNNINLNYTGETVLDINGSIIRVTDGVTCSGTAKACMLFAPYHAKLESFDEYSNVEISSPSVYYGKSLETYNEGGTQ